MNDRDRHRSKRRSTKAGTSVHSEMGGGGGHLLQIQVLFFQLRDVLALRLQTGTYVEGQPAPAATAIEATNAAAAANSMPTAAAAAAATFVHAAAALGVGGRPVVTAVAGDQPLVGAKKVQVRPWVAAQQTCNKYCNLQKECWFSNAPSEQDRRRQNLLKNDAGRLCCGSRCDFVTECCPSTRSAALLAARRT